MASHDFFLPFLLTLLFSIFSQNSIKFSVTNNAVTTDGGIRFDREIGALYAEQTLKTATDFIWEIFRQNPENNNNNNNDRKTVKKISLFIDKDYDRIAYTSNDNIFIGADYIAKYSGDVKNEITGIIYHETTRIWQWNGASQAPEGLINGIADYVRLKSGFFPSDWVSEGEGERWDEGNDVTARFLEYLEGLGNGFVGELNKKMRNGYDENYFVEIWGAMVDELWDYYKAECGKKR